MKNLKGLALISTDGAIPFYMVPVHSRFIFVEDIVRKEKYLRCYKKVLKTVVVNDSRSKAHISEGTPLWTTLCVVGHRTELNERRRFHFENFGDAY
jgi:hypothetical protein